MLARENLTPQKVISGNTDQVTTTVLPGYLYMYLYDPKLKETLPYYDRFPLVFPIERYKDGFLGLNLHYLGVNERIAILNKLKQFASAKNLTEKSRLRLSYELLVRTKNVAALSPCIKRYLVSLS